MAQTDDSISMKEWFGTCSAEQADAMSARQLDYEFKQDNLGSVWWKALQQLGFQHNGTKYSLPDSAPYPPTTEFTGNEIYEHLDRLCIPRLSSELEGFDERRRQENAVLSTSSVVNMSKDEMEWWREIRDELVFRKYRSEMEATTKSRTRRPTDGAAIQRKERKRFRSKMKNLTNQSDPGAELFMHKKSKKPKHSKTSLPQPLHAEISFPTVQQYAEMVKSNLNLDSVNQTEETYQESFSDWRFTCSLNQSLLFYGVGSKQVLLDMFATALEKDGDVVTIQGYDKEVTIEAILDLLVNHWLGGKDPSTRPYDIFLSDNSAQGYGSQVYPSHATVQRAKAISTAIAQQVEQTLRPVYLVLHNIDGVALRNPIAQEALSVLVHCSRVTRRKELNALRLVASVDHINGPALLWDSLTCQRFRWVWKHVSTYRPYVDEITQSTELLPRKSQNRRAHQHETTEEDAGIFDVLRSLAPRHAESLHVLADLQLTALQNTHNTKLSSSSDKGGGWINHVDLLKKCQLECIVTGDNQLRQFLKELVDHEIVERKGSSSETLRIPYDMDTLIQILNFEHEDRMS